MTEAEDLKQRGISHFQQKLYKEALEFFQQSYALFEKDGDLNNSAEVLNNIGVIHRVEGRDREAVTALETAQAHFEQVGDALKQAQTLGNLAPLYKKIEQYDKAVEAYTRAADIFHEAGEKNFQAETLMALGVMQFEAGDRMAGIANYESGLMKVKKPTAQQKRIRNMLKMRNRLTGAK